MWKTNHKPLEIIILKPLDSASKHLQQMLLQLQKCNEKVNYKKGEHMYLTDTLSSPWYMFEFFQYWK